MAPTTQPDLSRPRLKALAAWIRDDLDPIIAQNGPDRLRPDDVLALHELFQALRSSTTITALDLRATGIHRAVIEVAGTATRWPGRLADDCDDIILAWTSKFGRLEDLRPFMYGRGGRLEGIASAGEFSRATLLKRWQNTCPDKIAPKRSHRLGDLGFRPGAWWMSPLLAHHSGIINLEATEGGVCYDESGAYALVLRDSGEIEASSEKYFTYRCKQRDKGKYRLTSADARSRCPIRILRCHDLNSMWGPRAGIRYEGLYKVIGWTVRTAKSHDHIGKQYKTGDILYEVTFERVDPLPMAEVMKHPTATELDDYAEYKRLRRIHRDEHKRGAADKADVPIPGKDAPPIAARGTLVSQLRASASKPCPSPARTATSKEPTSLSPILGHPQASPTRFSIGSTSPPRRFTAQSSLELLQATHGSLNALRSGSDSPVSERNRPSQVSRRSPSVASERSHYSDIREVVPWIDDYDLELIAAAPSINTRPNRVQPTAPATPGAVTSSKTQKIGDSHSDRSIHLDRPSTPQMGRHGAKSSGDGTLRPGTMAKDGRKSLAVPRSRNPLAKLFDGAVETADLDEEAEVLPPDPAVIARSGQASRSASATSHEDIRRPLSPAPVRAGIPSSSLLTDTAHRNLIDFVAQRLNLDRYSSPDND